MCRIEMSGGGVGFGMFTEREWADTLEDIKGLREAARDMREQAARSYRPASWLRDAESAERMADHLEAQVRKYGRA